MKGYDDFPLTTAEAFAVPAVIFFHLCSSDQTMSKITN